MCFKGVGGQKGMHGKLAGVILAKLLSVIWDPFLVGKLVNISNFTDLARFSAQNREWGDWVIENTPAAIQHKLPKFTLFLSC